MAGQSRTPLIIVTRPAAGAGAFAARLTVRIPGARVLVAPLQEVREVNWMPPADPPQAQALILTSANAVAAAARAGLAGLALCVGDQTAEAARAAGFDAVSAGGDADALVALIAGRDEQTFWHLHGRKTRGDVAQRLRALGRVVGEAVVYETRPLPLSSTAREALASEPAVILPLFSPASARIAQAALADAPRTGRVAILSLSPAVERAAAGIAADLRLTARRPDADGMVEIVAEALNSPALA